MKHSAKSSESIWKERSSGKEKKTNTSIHMTGRELVSVGEAVSHPVLWFLTALGQILLLAGGFCGMLVSGLSLPVHVWILYPGVLILCVAATLFYFGERLNGFRMYGMMGGILLYAVILFLTQNQFLTGARQIQNAVIQCMNTQYESNLQMIPAGGNETTLTVCLLEIFVIVAFWLGAAVVYRPDVIWTMLLIFPAAALVLLAGGSPSVFSLFLLLFGMLSLLTAARSVRKKRLWGEAKTPRFEKNLICHKNIQKKTALLICGAGLCLSVLGFYIVRPGLSLHLEKAEHVTAKAEGKLMEAMIRILPEISAGKLNIRVEAAGGGVADGALGDAEGYTIQNVEDLKVTSSAKPQETIYLKGYVGSGYTGDHWLEATEDNFVNAAMNWKTEGKPGIYIQNLPFLRNLYIEKNKADGISRMQEITVERLNANSRYTYYPYNAFLNEFYEVQAGDGYVAGQSDQDDIFSYYPRASYKEEVEAWNADEDKKSVLDRVEASYAAFAASNYLEVPEGFEQLKEQCEKQEIKEGDLEGIQAYIKSFLTEGYTFDLDAPALPEGEDFVRYFLYESKKGYSTHFASAATLMFRMFGVPARYVVGYAAPSNLFTAQPEGNYMAILQGDNSHSWTEIYISGEGWTPVEMTPGALGTAEEVEFVGDQVENQGTPKEEQEDSSREMESREQEEEESDRLQRLLDWLGGKDSLESVIHLLAGILVTVLVLVFGTSYFAGRRRTLGLDRKRKPEKRIQDIFQAYYEELVKKGMSPEIESTSEEFALQVKKRNPSLKQEEFSGMLQLVLESCYGCARKKETDVKFMRNVYKKLRKDLRRRAK